MKLESKHEIMLCQKALYTKQLTYYYKLCEIYQALANHALNKYKLKSSNDFPIAKQIEEIYGTYLSKASKGDISFLERSTRARSFDDEEARLFKLFSNYSSVISQFKNGSELLNQTMGYYKIIGGKDDERLFGVDPNKLQDYYDYMETTSPYTQKFNDFINNNPSIWIGKNAYQKSKTALKKIREIDSSHIVNLPEFAEKISPKSFGVNISSARGRITSLPQEISAELKTFYSEKENKKYTKPISDFDVVKVVSNSAKNTAKEKYTAHKGTLSKAVKTASAIALSALLTFGAITHLNTVNKFSKLSATNNYENGYEVLIQDTTKDELSSIKQRIESLKNSSTVPTQEEFMEIRDRLDALITSVISDLTVEAFKNEYPGYTDIQVEDEYDLNANNVGTSPSNAEEYIRITAVSPSGSTRNFLVEKFSAPKGNPLKDNIVNEEILDGAGKSSDSPGKILRNKLKSIAPESNLTYTEKIENMEEIFKTFEEIVEDIDKLGGTKFTIKNRLLSNGISISVGIPDEISKDIPNDYNPKIPDDGNSDR